MKPASMLQKFFENENYFVNSFCQKLQGEASLIGSQLADSIIKTINKDKSLSIFGGETTVTVKNSYGKGGRSQELALSFAISMNKNYNKKSRGLFSLLEQMDGMAQQTQLEL